MLQASRFFGDNPFKRYPLTLDGTGAYNPSSISYMGEKETAKLASVLNDHPSTHHYYTIDFSPGQTAFFLYDIFTYSEFYKEPLGGAALQLLTDFIDRFGSKKMVDQFKSAVKKNQFYFAQRLILDIASAYYAKSPTAKERESLQFLHSILQVQTQMPSIVLSEGKNPGLSFVLMPGDTFSMLQRCVHGEEATLVQPVVGPETPRMIRAMDELPPVCSSDGEMTKIQEGLASLYPSATQLSGPSRPVELTHPDVNKTENPHDYDCHDFFLSWHDVFHAFRNGANYKDLFRHVRQLHDEKCGLATPHSGMSTVLWKLTDIDCNAGRLMRECDSHKSNAKKIDYITTSLKLTMKNFCEDFYTQVRSDDVILILTDVINNPSIWRQSFPDFFPARMDVLLAKKLEGHSEENEINQLAASINKVSTVKDLHGLRPRYQELLNKKGLTVSIKFLLFTLFEYRQCQLLMQDGSDYKAADIIVCDLLETSPDTGLFKLIKQQGYASSFYYSANTGMYFNKELREALLNLPFTVKPRLRENSPQALQAACIFLNRKKASDALLNTYKAFVLSASLSLWGEIYNKKEDKKFIDIIAISDNGLLEVNTEDIPRFKYALLQAVVSGKHECLVSLKQFKINLEAKEIAALFNASVKAGNTGTIIPAIIQGIGVSKFYSQDQSSLAMKLRKSLHDTGNNAEIRSAMDAQDPSHLSSKIMPKIKIAKPFLTSRFLGGRGRQQKNDDLKNVVSVFDAGDINAKQALARILLISAKPRQSLLWDGTFARTTSINKLYKLIKKDRELCSLTIGVLGIAAFPSSKKNFIAQMENGRPALLEAAVSENLPLPDINQSYLR